MSLEKLKLDDLKKMLAATNAARLRTKDGLGKIAEMKKSLQEVKKQMANSKALSALED